MNETKINFQINCRDCGKPMKSFNLTPLVLFCSKCKIKAEVSFKKILKVVTQNEKNY